MIADRRTSVAFTGHRTYRGAAADALRRTVGELYARGFRTFLSGMAVGFELAEADSVEVLAPAYHRGCYAVRNDFLVDNARVLVAWYDGSPGGTRYTVRRALGRGLEVVNLCPAAPVPPAPEPTLFG